MSPTAATTTPALASPADTLAAAELERRAALAFVADNKIDVCDLATLTQAGAVRTAIGDKQKAIIAKLAAPKAAAFALHRWICGLEAAALAPYAQLDTYEKEQIRRFNDAQTRERLARERELADQRRRDDEARAAAEAAALEADGDHALAAAVLAEAIDAPDPVIVLADDVRSIQRFRRTWHYRIDDETKIPRDFLEPALEKLRKYATAMTTTANVPGVTFFYTDDPIR
jgi:hypothetical protein